MLETLGACALMSYWGLALVALPLSMIRD